MDNPPFDVIFKDDRTEGRNEEGVHWIARGFSENVDIPARASIATKVVGSQSNSFTLKPRERTFIVCAFSSDYKTQDCQSAVIEKVLSHDKL